MQIHKNIHDWAKAKAKERPNKTLFFYFLFITSIAFIILLWCHNNNSIIVKEL